MPPVNSQVTEITVSRENGQQTAQVTVELEGFEEGESVQLSGFAAQRDGGFTSISGAYTVAAVNNGLTYLTVACSPSADFVDNKEVTAALWASKVWLTLLDQAGSGAWKSAYWAPKNTGDGAWGSGAQAPPT
jgi:hypothetical protein